MHLEEKKQKSPTRQLWFTTSSKSWRDSAVDVKRHTFSRRVRIIIAFIPDLPMAGPKVFAGLLHLIKESQRQMNGLCGSTQYGCLIIPPLILWLWKTVHWRRAVFSLSKNRNKNWTVVFWGSDRTGSDHSRELHLASLETQKNTPKS